MARRQQRRPPPRRIKGERSQGNEDTSALEASARRLVEANGGDPRRLEGLVVDLQQLRDDADRKALDDPSPMALRDYRRAVRELAEAQRAVELAARR
jgi:hypothetical protein